MKAPEAPHRVAAPSGLSYPSQHCIKHSWQRCWACSHMLVQTQFCSKHCSQRAGGCWLQMGLAMRVIQRLFQRIAASEDLQVGLHPNPALCWVTISVVRAS